MSVSANTSALLSKAAYAPPGSRQSKLDELGLSDFTVLPEDSNVDVLTVRTPEGGLVIAMRGTDISNATGNRNRDVGEWPNTGVDNPFGQRLTEVEALVNRLRKENKGKDITLTGHSLGGYLAARTAKDFNLPAIVFNPGEGISNNPGSEFINELLNKHNSNVLIVKTAVDPVSAAAYAGSGDVYTVATKFQLDQHGIDNFIGLNDDELEQRASSKISSVNTRKRKLPGPPTMYKGNLQNPFSLDNRVEDNDDNRFDDMVGKIKQQWIGRKRQKASGGDYDEYLDLTTQKGGKMWEKERNHSRKLERAARDREDALLQHEQVTGYRGDEVFIDYLEHKQPKDIQYEPAEGFVELKEGVYVRESVYEEYRNPADESMDLRKAVNGFTDSLPKHDAMISEYIDSKIAAMEEVSFVQYVKDNYPENIITDVEAYLKRNKLKKLPERFEPYEGHYVDNRLLKAEGKKYWKDRFERITESKMGRYDTKVGESYFFFGNGSEESKVEEEVEEKTPLLGDEPEAVDGHDSALGEKVNEIDNLSYEELQARFENKIKAEYGENYLGEDEPLLGTGREAIDTSVDFRTAWKNFGNRAKAVHEVYHPSSRTYTEVGKDVINQVVNTGIEAFDEMDIRGPVSRRLNRLRARTTQEVKDKFYAYKEDAKDVARGLKNDVLAAPETIKANALKVKEGVLAAPETIKTNALKVKEGFSNVAKEMNTFNAAHARLRDVNARIKSGALTADSDEAVAALRSGMVAHEKMQMRLNPDILERMIQSGGKIGEVASKLKLVAASRVGTGLKVGAGVAGAGLAIYATISDVMSIVNDVGVVNELQNWLDNNDGPYAYKIRERLKRAKRQEIEDSVDAGVNAISTGIMLFTSIFTFGASLAVGAAIAGTEYAAHEIAVDKEKMDYLAENYNYHSGENITKENIAYYIKHRDTDGKVQEYIKWALSYNPNDSFYTDRARLRLKKQIEQLMTPKAGNAMQASGYHNPTVYNVNGAEKSIHLGMQNKDVTWYEPASTEIDFNIGVGIEDNRYELLWQMMNYMPPTVFDVSEESMTLQYGSKEEHQKVHPHLPWWKQTANIGKMSNLKYQMEQSPGTNFNLSDIVHKGVAELKHYNDAGGLKERQLAEYERLIREKRKTDPYFGMTDDEKAQEKQYRLAVANWVAEENRKDDLFLKEMRKTNPYFLMKDNEKAQEKQRRLAIDNRLTVNAQDDDNDIYHPQGGDNSSLAANAQADTGDIYHPLTDTSAGPAGSSTPPQITLNAQDDYNDIYRYSGGGLG